MVKFDLNTTQTSCNSFDKKYASACEEFEYLNISKKPRIEASVSSEENSKIYEDVYETACENQNSNNASANLSQNTENTKHDFLLSTPISCSTPTNGRPMIGKVAELVANFKQKTENKATAALNYQAKSKRKPTNINIKKLSEIYEPNQKKNSTIWKSRMKAIKATFKPKVAVPEISSKTKVQQIAQVFNAKTPQHLERNTARKSPILKTSRVAKPILVANTATESNTPKPSNNFATYGTVPQLSPQLRRCKSQCSLEKNSFSAEETFSQLSVSDKVQLYTKFINDMNQENQKLSKTNTETLDLNMKTQFANGEVINEKQTSVKNLIEKLEAKCNLTKETISQKTLQRMQSIIDTTILSNEDDNLSHDNEYTASAVEDVKDYSTCSLSSSVESLHDWSNHKRLVPHLNLMEPPQKRRYKSKHSSNFDKNANPLLKKLHCTHFDELNPINFFQNTKVQEKFFEWMQTENYNDCSESLLDNEQKFSNVLPTEEHNSATLNINELAHKSAVDILLEEVRKKLSNINISTNELKNIQTKDKNLCTPPPTPILNKAPQKPKRLAPLPPIEVSETAKLTSSNFDSGIDSTKVIQVPCLSSSGDNNSTISSQFHTAPACSASFTASTNVKQGHHVIVFAESGVSSSKSYSIDTQPTARIKHRNTELDSAQKQPHCKKMRRFINCESTSDKIESNFVKVITSKNTADYVAKKLTMKFKLQRKRIKKLYVKTRKAIPLLRKSITLKKSKSTRANNFKFSSKKLVKKIKQAFHSSRCIKLAYNLNFLKSKLRKKNLDKNELNEKELLTPPHEPNLTHSFSTTNLWTNTNCSVIEPPPLAVGFVEQGFDTETNSIKSPMKNVANFEEPHTTPCCDLDIPHASHKPTEVPLNFSTYIQKINQKFFINPPIIEEQHLSALKSNFSESSLNIDAMEVIPEKHLFEAKNTPALPSLPSDAIENSLSENVSTRDITYSAINFNLEKHSKFWILIDDYMFSMKIHYYSIETTRQLAYNFSQKYKNRFDLNFGIDNLIFSFYKPRSYLFYNSRDESIPKNLSHYWFSTAELVIPFNGEFMPKEDILRFFTFLRGCIKSDSVIRCGVDDIEFTCLNDRYSKYNASNENSNVQEEHVDFAWKNPKFNDVDKSKFDLINLISKNLLRNSNSSFSSTSTISYSNKTTSSSSSDNYDSQSTDEDSFSQISKDAQLYNLKKSKIDKIRRHQSLKAPKLKETLTKKQRKLKTFEDRKRSSSYAANEKFKKTPEQIKKLESFIKVIDNIRRDNGFRNCSAQQMETFLFYLKQYNRHTVTKVNDNNDTILEELHNKTPV